MSRKIRNATVSDTQLGFYDGVHSPPAAWVYLDFGGSGQGFGGRRLGGEYTHTFVYGVLLALEVESWEKLKGTPCRVDADHGCVYRIGHFLKDQWFDPSEARP